MDFSMLYFYKYIWLIVCIKNVMPLIKIQQFLYFSTVSYVNIVCYECTNIAYRKETSPFNNIPMTTSNMSVLEQKCVSYLHFNSL